MVGGMALKLRCRRGDQAISLGNPAPMTSQRFDLQAGVAVLERTPVTLREMLAGLPSQWIDGDEGPETWSPYVVVGHLVHGERTDWIPRARIILEHGLDRRFEPFDRSAQFRDSKGKSLEKLLDELADLRRENLATLTGWQLSDAQLDLQGEHPELGVVTLRELLGTWVAHDLGHIAQISRVMAKQYRDAVGPWRAYLPVMDR
jgi:DinB superfamily